MKRNILSYIGVIIFTLFTAALWSSLLIDPAGNGGFESGATFADNGWILVNGSQTNKWELGTAAAGYTGARAGLISNNGGTNWTYTISSASTVYFYRDIFFPSGEGDIQLSFDFKGTGESTYDYIAVFLVPTTTTPTAGTLLSSGKIGNTYYNYANEWIHAGISISSTYANTTQRLVFCWRNDGSGGYDPPGVIDNIKLTSNPISALSGTYYVDNTVATGGVYFNSLVDAVLALNNNGVVGATEFRITDGQTFTNMLPHITATGTYSTPITFVKSGSGTNPKLRNTGTGTTSTAPFDAGVAIAGGDWITFNGLDIEGTGAVQITSTTYAYPLEYGYYVYNAAAGNGAQNNTIKNCKITLNRLNTSSIGVYQNIPVTPTSTGGANSGNIYSGLTVENVYNGIYLKGNATYPDDGCVVGLCFIGASSANDIGNGSSATYGIRVDSGANVNIHSNQIRNITGTSSSSVDGIFVSNSGSGSVSVGTVQVAKNHIYNLNSTSTSAGRVCGMRVNITGATGSSSRIYNNMVWGLNSASTVATSRRIIGIFVQDAGGGSTNATHNVDFNSVRIEHSNLATVSSAYEIGTTSGPVINTRSNIFANFTGAQTGSPYHTAWASTSNTLIGNTGSVSNNNILHISNSSNGYVGRGSSSNFATLIDWQNAMGQDGQSKSSNPQFVDPTDLHINDSVPTPVEGNGLFQSWVIFDYDGHERSMDWPDIGADEGNFQTEVECETPIAQPTDLILIPGITSISGSFSASDAESYLVVRHTDTEHTEQPQDENVYGVGSNLGNGVIVGAGSGTTFNTTGLTAESDYYFTVYAYNESGLNGPKYLRDEPLTGAMQTLPTAPSNPGSFTATAFNSEQINLAATANGNEDNIMVAWNSTSTFGIPLVTGYSEGSSITGGGSVLYMGPASGLSNHPGLQEGTTYYYKAWSYITAERTTYYVYSTGLTANATTPVSPQNVPVDEGFESITTAGSFPLGWTRAGTKWSSQISPQTYNRAARSGTDYLTCFYNATSTDWMFSRGVNLDASKLYDFGIWYNTDGYGGWLSFKMSIGTSASGAAMTTDLASVSSPTNTTYAQLTRAAWQPPVSGVYYIGLQATSNTTPWYMSFDDFTISETPTEPLFQVSPASKNFGTVSCGATASQLFTISNVGQGQLGISSVSLVNAVKVGDVDQYNLIDTNNYSETIILDGGESIQVTVNFQPTAEGTFNVKLLITDNLTKVVNEVPISGTGSDANNYGGGDSGSTAGGYYFANNLSIAAPSVPSYSWITQTSNEVPETPTSGTLDDGYWGPIPMGFEFLFYNNPFTELFITTNGTLAFGAGNTTFTNTDLPAVAVPNNQICLFWDDLEYYPLSSKIYYGGNANSFVVTYENMGRTGSAYNPDASVTAQAILYSDGRIKFQYFDVTGTMTATHTATIGLENADGTKGVRYHFNDAGGPVGTGGKAGGVAVMFGDDPDTLPVELSSFTAVLTADLAVKLTWVAQSETNHSGYNVLRGELDDLAYAIKINPSLIDREQGEELGTQISYSYSDIEAYSNMVYYYWLESVSLDGVSEFYGPLSVTIGDPSLDPLPPVIPMVTQLMNAFPNPFNPNTNIRYSLKEAGKVNIDIYNVKGQLVRSFKAEHNSPGYYQVSWDGRDTNGRNVSSGIYMYRMTSGSYTSAKKMILAK